MPDEIDYTRYCLSGPADLMRLAKSFMKRSDWRGLNPDDALSACHAGLAKALSEYDPSRGKFSTYAYWKMRGEVSVEQETLNFPMRIRRASLSRCTAGVESPATRDMRRAIDSCSSQVRIDHYSEVNVADSRPGSDPIASVIEAEERALVDRMLSVLSDRQRRVVESYLDLDARGGATFEEIAVEFGLGHRESARQVYLGALERIRVNMGVAP